MLRQDNHLVVLLFGITFLQEVTDEDSFGLTCFLFWFGVFVYHWLEAFFLVVKWFQDISRFLFPTEVIKRNKKIWKPVTVLFSDSSLVT